LWKVTLQGAQQDDDRVGGNARWGITMTDRYYVERRTDRERYLENRRRDGMPDSLAPEILDQVAFYLSTQVFTTTSDRAADSPNEGLSTPSAPH